MRTTRLKTLFWLIAGAALTILSGLAFANNVAVVIRWSRAFTAAAGNAAEIPGKIPGPIPWLDWSAVDYSCASTFIPFFGFLLFTRALFRILTGVRHDAAHFPFFKSYDQVNVSLGLIGTLWGIILIGYYDMETVTMASLMLCLHTALFSTLVAVVWVFLVVHPLLQPLALSLLEEADLAFEEDDRGLGEILSDLRAAADGIGSTLAREESAVTAFASAVEGAAARLSGFSDAVGAHAEAIERREREADALLARRLEAIGKAQDEALGKFAAAAGEAASASRIAAETAANDISKAVSAALDAMAAARKAGDAQIAAAFEERLKAMDAADMERRKKFAEALSARLKEMDAAQAEREKKFDEVLERRIAKLSKESLENSERAAQAESKIARIRAAFE